jgi:hypothetical protein
MILLTVVRAGLKPVAMQIILIIGILMLVAASAGQILLSA